MCGQARLRRSLVLRLFAAPAYPSVEAAVDALRRDG